MLDLTISKCRYRRSLLQWRPFFKPTARAVPLAMTSCHHKMVHSWARSGLIRLARNSCCAMDFEVAKARYTCNLYAAHLEHSRILDIMLFNPFQDRALSSCVANQLCSTFNKAADAVHITMILDYHPYWDLSDLQKGINRLCARHSLFCRLLWGSAVNIRVAWRNASPTLAITFRSL